MAELVDWIKDFIPEADADTITAEVALGEFKDWCHFHVSTKPMPSGYAWALAVALEKSLTALDEAQLRSIEARNPGIDIEEMKRVRARNADRKADY